MQDLYALAKTFHMSCIHYDGIVVCILKLCDDSGAQFALTLELVDF